MTRKEIASAIEEWLAAWDRHDLDEVIALFSEDAVFETWTGMRVEGRENIRKAWAEWFEEGGFRFISGGVIIDEDSQTVVFPWRYEGPAKCFGGKMEKRRGIALVRFEDGGITETIS